jgi:hypothetical protein
MRNETSFSKNTTPSYWYTLKTFWGEERTDKWHNAVFSTPSKTEIVENVILLNSNLHKLWGNGEMALKPIELSDDKKILTLEVHWIRNRRVTSPTSSVPPPPLDILQVPSLEVAPSDVADRFDYRDVRAMEQIASGHRVSMTTDDPVERPLPSLELLEMQWVLQRLSAISGAAEPKDDWSDDDSSDFSAGQTIEEEDRGEHAIQSGNL